MAHYIHLAEPPGRKHELPKLPSNLTPSHALPLSARPEKASRASRPPPRAFSTVRELPPLNTVRSRSSPPTLRVGTAKRSWLRH